MKKILIVGAVVIVVLLIILLTTDGKPKETKLISDTLYVSAFTSDGEETGKVLLQVPFLADLNERSELSIAVDVDGDGAYSEEEKLVSGYPVRGAQDWRSGFYAAPTQALTDGLAARVTIGGTEYGVTTRTDVVEVGALFDLVSVIDPETSMKGWGTAVAHAQEVVEITQENVPDLSQQPGECAPTSAANSLISLIDKNGKPADLPGTPEEMIEDLKGEMNWNREQGVAPDNFVTGKNAWAKKHGLPIVTEKVGDVHGLSTEEAIQEALEAGSAVELRIKFAETGSTEIAGGHMVTVTGIHQADGQTYIDINDPATPEGTETVEISSNQITNYGPWRGITVLSWGFVQTWKLEESVTTGDTSSIAPKPVAVEMAFDHVKPGEYSEVYAVIMTTPGNEVTAQLGGPAVDFKGTQHVIADDNGQAHFTWKIYQYGEYSVSGADEGGAGFTGSVTVN